MDNAAGSIGDQEVELMRLVASLGGEAGFEAIASRWQTLVPLEMERWKPVAGNEARWQYELRRALRALHQLGLLAGSEFGVWSLTSKGYDLINAGSALLQNGTSRALRSTYELIRDTQPMREIKALYGHRCQVCEWSLPLGDTSAYVEAHHLRPLGRPHDGPDIKQNLIALCPNHHACFDHAMMAVNPTTLALESNPGYGGHQVIHGPLKLLLHTFDEVCLQYQYEQFLQRLQCNG